MAERRFPPPWSVDDPDLKLGQDCYIVRDVNNASSNPRRGNQKKLRIRLSLMVMRPWGGVANGRGRVLGVGLKPIQRFNSAFFLLG